MSAELHATESDELDAVEAEDGPPPSVRRIAREVRVRSATLRCTLAAVGAWAITVAPLVLTSRASIVTRVLALLCLAPAVAGPQLIGRSHKLSRHVGVTGYVAAVLLTWGVASADQVLASVDTFRAILGAFAWGVYGLAWSHPWSVPDVDLARAPEGETVGLKPRRKPPNYAVGIAVTGAICALVCLAIGWTIQDPDRAVFAQAVAIAAAVALLTSASTIAVIAGKERSRGRKKLPINRSVINTMALMLVLIIAAVALALS